jgi:hypothetical protein
MISTRPFAIETDACAMGVGVVLTQHGHQGAHLSKAFGAANSSLTPRKRFFWSDIWLPYLQRGPFLIITALLVPIEIWHDITMFFITRLSL